MEVTFAENSLARLEADLDFTAGFHPDIVRAYRRCMQLIRAADDERDIYAVKGRHFEKLDGEAGRLGQRSLRLNDQWRLIVQVRKGKPKNSVHIIQIKDYH